MATRSRYFLGPTSLVSAKRRVTLLGPPKRWCTNSKAPPKRKLEKFIDQPWIYSKPRGEALNMLLDMHFDTQFYGSVVGDVTKTKKVAQIKNHGKKLSDTWKNHGTYHLCHECIMPQSKKTAWALGGLVSLDPSLAFRSRKCYGNCLLLLPKIPTDCWYSTTDSMLLDIHPQNHRISYIGMHIPLL